MSKVVGKTEPKPKDSQTKVKEEKDSDKHEPASTGNKPKMSPISGPGPAKRGFHHGRDGGPGRDGGGRDNREGGHGIKRERPDSGPGRYHNQQYGNQGQGQGGERDFRGGSRGMGDREDSFGNGRGRGMGRGRGGPNKRGGHGGGERSNFHLDQPQVSLEEAMPDADKKFTGRCRLFVGNLPANCTEDEFKEMFTPYGEFTEVFLNAQKCFGFIRMDLRKNAQAAKDALDGLHQKGRTLRVRFATHGAALKVKYLPSHVSNELLAQAFSIFGELERAVVIVDDRGKPTGDGIVEFARKPGAQSALKRISEGIFVMGASPRPITVEPLEVKDEEDGYSEKFIHKTADHNKEREQPPRFAPPGSFEFEFGQKWKDLFRIHEEQKVNLQMEFEAAASKLDIEQAGAEMEHQRQMLRQDLLRRQEELRRLEESHQMQLQKRLDMKQEEERRRLEDNMMREEMMNMRRQQQQQQQQQINMQPPPAPPACLGLEQSNRGGHRGMQGHGNMENMDDDSHNDYRNERQNRPMRQSRFDQPANYNQGQQQQHGQGRMGMGNGNMGGGMSDNRGGQRHDERGMNDDYFESKRSRRY